MKRVTKVKHTDFMVNRFTQSKGINRVSVPFVACQPPPVAGDVAVDVDFHSEYYIDTKPVLPTNNGNLTVAAVVFLEEIRQLIVTVPIDH